MVKYFILVEGHDDVFFVKKDLFIGRILSFEDKALLLDGKLFFPKKSI